MRLSVVADEVACVYGDGDIGECAAVRNLAGDIVVLDDIARPGRNGSDLRGLEDRSGAAEGRS